MYLQSKIIVSQNKEKNYLLKLLNIEIEERNINIISTLENSIGIKDVEKLSEIVSKKSSDIKIILILESDKLTTEAQNSLLKILEEPSPNTLIVLQTNNIEALLETIKSRCQLIYDNKSINDEEYNNIEVFFKDFINVSYFEKIKIVEKFLKDYNNKESIKKAILVILNDINKKRLFIEEIPKIEKAYKAVNTNVSPKLIFDFVILSLTKT